MRVSGDELVSSRVVVRTIGEASPALAETLASCSPSSTSVQRTTRHGDEGSTSGGGVRDCSVGENLDD